MAVLCASIEFGTEGKCAHIGGGAWCVGLQPAELWRAAVVVIDGDLIKGATAIVTCIDADNVCSRGQVDTALQQTIIGIEIEATHRHAVVQNLNLVVVQMTTQRSIERISSLLNGTDIGTRIHDLNGG